MKDFLNSKRKKILLYLLIIFMSLGIFIPLAVLTKYYLKLGNISGDPQDWSAFGSVLSGSFTLLAAISTTATFLFLIWQKKESDEVVAKQITAMQFEQYIKHRAIFMETLDELETKYDKDFIFRERNELYRLLFPENGAFHISYKGSSFCEFLVEKLQDVWNTQNKLICSVDVYHAEEFCWTLRRLHERLGINWERRDREGDISVFETHIDDRGKKKAGLNLLNIANDLERTDYIVRTLLEFSAQEELYITMRRYLTDLTVLFENLYNSALERDQTGVSFYSETDNGLSALYELYQYSKLTMHRNERIFDPIYSRLHEVIHKGRGDKIFSSTETLRNFSESCRSLVIDIQKDLAKKTESRIDITVDGLNFLEIYKKINDLGTIRKLMS
ncbi:hypothetical protein [Pseudomonas asplenii]|uniref:hypothetical protein n=1 Tax=Pseudomonas asplenii TaxID=53407 RepID=UPI0006B5DFC7|nr:hypothetical protein [Pseudomonas fuscovaginae]KPA94400.1 hypothetical protein PF70_05625 [Pseudomonas fuscovaginae]